MRNCKKFVSILLAVLLCAMAVISIADTEERRYKTDFDQDMMLTHIENMAANGPHSIFHTEENELGLQYILSQLHDMGFVEGDRTDVPAYMIQNFMTDDDDHQAFYLDNIIVHIPANAAATTGDALMFMGHTDSVPMGEGVSDDGVAVATMLEAIRYYTQQMEEGYTISNDLVFCFVNAEEFGMLGSDKFMREFAGFDDVLSRIRFGVNLESRGTSGTLIMFETAENNYNTIKVFSQINRNVFTSSIGTMVYSMMPNGTDFSNFKDFYQGLNFANLGGGQNYHTQNDDVAHMGRTYLSQYAMIVDAIIEKLGSYDLDLLHDARESAIFFSYLNLTTVVYSRAVSYIIGVVLLALMAANIWMKRKDQSLLKTAKGIAAVVLGLALTAGITYGLYFLFQYIAVAANVIDIQAVGAITFSNVYIVVSIGLIALAVTILSAQLLTRWFGIEGRDMARAFAYIHGFLGLALTVALPDASYLFAISGLLFVANELLITIHPDADGYHGELLATALYLPIIMPILVLATSALGLTMAYVFGMIFALGLYSVGITLSGVKHAGKTAAVAGLAIALIVSVTKMDANANLLGKQGVNRLPWDDALVYVVDAEAEPEYRIYDLNSKAYLEAYAPEMTWRDGYYVGSGDTVDVEYSIESTVEGNALTVRKFHEDNQIYLTFSNIEADSFSIDDGTTIVSYPFEGRETYDITLHSDCVLTVFGGSADLHYQEVHRDYEKLMPDHNEHRLHFNLWLTADETLK